MSASPTTTLSPDQHSLAALPPEGRAALRAGVIGNWIDNIHVFLPLVALAPALKTLAGPGAAAGTGALVVIAMLLGRPLGGMIFGRISDRLGRTRTTRLAILGTAICAFLIAALPTHELLGVGTMVAILSLRFIGGIFVAGEYSAAIPLAMEWSAAKKRGMFSGLILSMAPWAQGTIAFSTAVLLRALGPDAYATWGWRLLFVLGGCLSLGMFAYYRTHVTDAPTFHRAQRAVTSGERPGLSEVLVGRYAPRFWQVFTLMTGLWFMTVATVLVLPSRLASDGGLDATGVSIAMGVASVAQAIMMAIAGHLSTLAGRRALFVGWGLLGMVAGPFVWQAAANSGLLWRAAVLAAVLQVITVSAYGPVSAYLSERFPTAVRSTGYGMGYSWSLVISSLFPFYLPHLLGPLGHQGAVMILLGLGGLLLVAGAFFGPKLRPDEIDAELDEVSLRGDS